MKGQLHIVRYRQAKSLRYQLDLRIGGPQNRCGQRHRKNPCHSQLNPCRLQCRSDIPALPHTYRRKALLLWFSIITVGWIFNVAQFRKYSPEHRPYRSQVLQSRDFSTFTAVLRYDWTLHPGDIEHGGASAQETSPWVRYQDSPFRTGDKQKDTGKGFSMSGSTFACQFSLKLHSREWTKDTYDAAVSETVFHPTTNEQKAMSTETACTLNMK